MKLSEEWLYIPRSRGRTCFSVGDGLRSVFFLSFFCFFVFKLRFAFFFIPSETCFLECVALFPWILVLSLSNLKVVLQEKWWAPVLLLVIAYRTEEQQQQAYFWEKRRFRWPDVYTLLWTTGRPNRHSVEEKMLISLSLSQGQPRVFLSRSGVVGYQRHTGVWTRR